jgi:hypothetical protein
MTAGLSEPPGTGAIDLVILNEAPPLLAHRVVIRGGSSTLRPRRCPADEVEARVIQKCLDVKPLLELESYYMRKRIKEGGFGVRS